jgi:glycosyltransferase involved in cell wall biosynthesis
VWVRGVIYGGSGYAQENLLTVMGLASRGIPVRIDPLQIQHDTQNLLSTETRTALEYLKLQPLDLARSVIFQEMPADSFRRDFYAKRRIGRTMFETDGLPHDWAEKCNAMDEIWVPSRFNVETFARAGVKEARLHLVQEGENTQMFRPGHEALPIAERRGFNFLSIFEWRKRKGPDVLFKAFCSEFRADEDVALILRAYATPQPDEDLLPRVTYFIERTCKKRLEDIPPIILLPGFLPQNDLPKLYATADCFVLPTRGEGWGRPLTESLASEVPVIATGWSGQMDFLTQANSYLVDFKLVPTGADIDLEFLAGHRWAEPSVEHLRELMRHVFEHRDEAKEKARQGRRDIVANHDMSVTMERWGREFDRVLA